MILNLENWYLGYSQIISDCRNNNNNENSTTSSCCMILCHADVDAMAAARILSYMLRNDGIQYILESCRTNSQLHTKLLNTTNQGIEVSAIILLNLGATRNLTRLYEEHLNPDTTNIYLMDCRRPVHLANIHDENNIVVFWDGIQSEDNIPSDGDNLSGDESSTSSEEEDDDEDDMDEDGENEFQLDDDDVEAEFDDTSNNEPKATSKNDTTAADEEEQPVLDVGQNQETDYDGEDEDDDHNNIGGQKQKRSHRHNHDDDDDEMSLTAEETQPTQETETDLTMTDDTQQTQQQTQLPTLTPHEIHKNRRERLRQYYASGSFHGVPASYAAYKIATQLRFKDNSDLLWLACVGLTDAYIHTRLDRAGFSSLALQLRNICNDLFPNDEVTRVTDAVIAEDLLGSNGNSNNTRTRISFSGNGKIISESDFRFFMLRHTSLYDAMYYSDYISTKLQLHTTKGKHKLQEMLAKMGYPLDECYQPFAFMKPILKRQLKDKFEQYSEEYGLINYEFTSFFRITGYQSLLSASDTSYAVTALLECNQTNKIGIDPEEIEREAFNIAYDALNTNQAPTVSFTGLSTDGNNLSSLVNGGKHAGSTGLGAGIRLAMSLQKNIISTASSLMERSAITRLSHFRYAYITCTSQGENGITGEENNIIDEDMENNNDDNVDHIFSKPLALTRLAHYLMDMNRENGKWTGNKARPLILMSEKPITKTFVVVGYEYPESSGDLIKNHFGKNFELAAQSMKGTFLFDSFDSNVIEVARTDVQRFIEQLHYLMDNL